MRRKQITVLNGFSQLERCAIQVCTTPPSYDEFYSDLSSRSNVLDDALLLILIFPKAVAEKPDSQICSQASYRRKQRFGSCICFAPPHWELIFPRRVSTSRNRARCLLFFHTLRALCIFRSKYGLLPRYTVRERALM